MSGPSQIRVGVQSVYQVTVRNHSPVTMPAATFRICLFDIDVCADRPPYPTVSFPAIAAGSMASLPVAVLPPVKDLGDYKVATGGFYLFVCQPEANGLMFGACGRTGEITLLPAQ
jgi:hypothetical protein